MDTKRPPTLCSITEAALFCNYAERTLRYLCETGVVPARKVGRAWIVNRYTARRITKARRKEK